MGHRHPRSRANMKGKLVSEPEFEDYDLTIMDFAEPAFGAQMGQQVLKVHPRSKCEGRDIPCVIHSPSEHHMREWPLNWRSDTGVMERVCQHGVGHPDPDHMAYVLSLTPEHRCDLEMMLAGTDRCPYPHLEWQGTHGCDGCCREGSIHGPQ